MQDPSVVKIPETKTPVEPPKAVFPLPADHECARNGFGAPYSGEWDYAEDHDLPQLMIQNAMERVANPVSLTKMYLSGMVLRIAEAHLPPLTLADALRGRKRYLRIGSIATSGPSACHAH